MLNPKKNNAEIPLVLVSVGIMCLDSCFKNIYDAERSDTDKFTINLGHCVHPHTVVYMYLIFATTGQNVSNDGNKGVQICISPTFIEPSVYQGIKAWHASMLDAC